jgi:hypothetical protein
VGIFEYLLGPKEADRDGDQPAPSTAGAGPDVNQGRNKTKTEKDLRRVQGTHDPKTDSFKETVKR